MFNFFFLSNTLQVANSKLDYIANRTSSPTNSNRTQTTTAIRFLHGDITNQSICRPPLTLQAGMKNVWPLPMDVRMFGLLPVVDYGFTSR